MYLNRAIPTAGQITLALMTPNGLVPKCLHTPRHNVRETIIKPRMNRIYHHCICACNCNDLCMYVQICVCMCVFMYISVNIFKKIILIYLHIYIQDPGALPMFKMINPGYKWKYPGVCARARERERARAYVNVCTQMKT